MDPLAYCERPNNGCHCCTEHLDYGRLLNLECHCCTEHVGYGARLNNGGLFCTDGNCRSLYFCAKHVCAGGKSNKHLDYGRMLNLECHCCTEHVGYGGMVNNGEIGYGVKLNNGGLYCTDGNCRSSHFCAKHVCAGGKSIKHLDNGRMLNLECHGCTEHVGYGVMLNNGQIGYVARLNNGGLCCTDGNGRSLHFCAKHVCYGGKSNNGRYLCADNIGYGGKFSNGCDPCKVQVGYGGKLHNGCHACAIQTGYIESLKNGRHHCAGQIVFHENLTNGCHTCADQIIHDGGLNSACRDQIYYGRRLNNGFHYLHKASIFLLSLLSVVTRPSNRARIHYMGRLNSVTHWLHRVFIFLLSVLLVATSSSSGASSLGVNYGMIANNLPPPIEVVSLIRSISVGKSKLYSSDPNVLQAFANTGISFIIGIGNEDVGSLTDPDRARQWVQQHIGQFYPETKIIGVTVGNEIFGGDDTTLMSQLLPAMENIRAAIVSLGLDGKISISTPHSLAVLENSFPPSSGSFKSEFVSQYIKPHLEFLSETSSPFMINAYPFFAYKNNPQEVSLDYVLFEPNPGVTDPGSGLRYYNMFDAQVDAVYVALEALGYGHLKVMVSETGWPSAGDADEAGATVANAEKYNANLINHLASGRGTPLRPDQHVETYIFALFNENMKPGPTSERNYGLFHPDGSRVYNFPVHNSDPSSAFHLSTEVCPSLKLSLICLFILLFNLVVPW